MRAEWTLLAGLALGAGGALLAAGAGKTPPAPRPSDTDALASVRSTAAEVVATLGTAPAPSEPTPPTRGSPAAAAVVEVDLRDLLELAKNPPGKNATWQVHSTLADLYAHAGREDALRRVLDAALAAGENSSALVGWFAFLPPERRGRALASFLGAHPDAKPGPVALAWAWLAAGDPVRALPAAVEHLSAVQGNDAAMLCSLYAADADKADFEVWRTATDGDWPQAPVSFVIAAACSAMRQDLLPRWQQRLQFLQGPAIAGREPTEADRFQAVVAAEQQAREAPEDADRWVELARARGKAGDPRGAIAAWRTAIDKAGPDADLLTQFAAFDAAAAFPTIEAAAREAQEDDVLLAYVGACLRVGKFEEAGAAFFRMHTLEADEWLNAGIAGLAPWPALARIDRLLSNRTYRDKAEFLLARADALAALGRSSTAYDAYLKYEEATGRNDLAWDGLLRAEPARAAAHFETMRVPTDPDDRLECAYAVALLRTGRVAAAEAVADAVLTRWQTSKSYDDRTLGWLAVVLPERVIAYTRKLLEEQHVDRHCLAAVLCAGGKVAEARAEYDECIREGSDDAAILIARGRLR